MSSGVHVSERVSERMSTAEAEASSAERANASERRNEWPSSSVRVDFIVTLPNRTVIQNLS